MFINNFNPKPLIGKGFSVFLQILHNIGLAVAKEITINWHFNKEVLSALVDSGLREFYMDNGDEKDTHSFISANSQMEKQLLLIYISSLSYFKPGWTEMIWEELFLEIAYKDIHDFQYEPKIFKVSVYVSTHYAAFRFHRVDSINLSKVSTMRIIMLEE